MTFHLRPVLAVVALAALLVADPPALSGVAAAATPAPSATATATPTLSPTERIAILETEVKLLEQRVTKLETAATATAGDLHDGHITVSALSTRTTKLEAGLTNLTAESRARFNRDEACLKNHYHPEQQNGSTKPAVFFSPCPVR